MSSSTRSAGRRPIVCAAAILAAVGAALPLLATSAAAASGRGSGASATLAGRRGIGLDRPTAITVDKGRLWVVDAGSDSVTELSGSGALIRTVSGPAYDLRQPDAIAGDGADLFVVNHAGSVTEIDQSDGRLVRVVKGALYKFGGPNALVVDGGDVWVVDGSSDRITEFKESTGSMVRVVSDTTNARYGFAGPDAVAAVGADLWVTNATGGSKSDPAAGSVTVLRASTGAFVRRVDASADGLIGPAGVAFDGTHVWVTDSGSYQVTELTDAGKLVQVVTNSSNDADYGFDHPTAVVVHAGFVYVDSPPGTSPMVTEVTATTAEGNWYECDTNVPDPKFDDPTGIAAEGTHLWVVSPGDNMLTELDLSQKGAAIGWFS